MSILQTLISFFDSHPSEKINVRSLAGDLQLNYNSVRRYVYTLRKTGLLTSNQKGTATRVNFSQPKPKLVQEKFEITKPKETYYLKMVTSVIYCGSGSRNSKKITVYTFENNTIERLYELVQFADKKTTKTCSPLRDIGYAQKQVRNDEVKFLFPEIELIGY